MKYYYDLHLHSCLSPCGSEDMTPVNLAAMCALAGLDIVALTDHNTCGNWRRLLPGGGGARPAGSGGDGAVHPGGDPRSLSLPHPLSRGGVRGVCIPPPAPVVQSPRRLWPSNLYGRGRPGAGRDPRFLAGHTDIGLEEVSRLAAAFGGAAFPAHIDRPSFSLLGVLGLWMPELGFPLAEVSRQCPPEFRLRPDLAGLRLITNSDAHYLDQVWEAEHCHGAAGADGCRRSLLAAGYKVNFSLYKHS